MTEQTFLEEAAAVETGSEHPLAQAVVENAPSNPVSRFPKRRRLRRKQAAASVQRSVGVHTWLAMWRSWRKITFW